MIPLAARRSIGGPLIRTYSSSGAPGPVLLDTFAGADNTLLPAHTPDVCPVGAVYGEAWQNASILAASLRILSGKAVMQSGQVRCGNTIDTGAADCIITMDAEFASDTLIRVVYRYADKNNNWRANIDTSNLRMQIIEFTSGVGTTRATTTIPSVAGQTIALAMTLNGDSMSLSIPGYTVSYSSAMHKTVTTHGPYIQAVSGGGSIDNFRVTI